MIYRREAHNLYAKRDAEGQYVLHVPGVVFCVPSVLDEKSACLKDAMECHGGIGDSRIAASSLKAAKSSISIGYSSISRSSHAVRRSRPCEGV